MLARVYSGAVYGVEAYPVEIEVNAGRGEVNIIIVGLPDAAVKESKDRVHTALVNSGFRLHPGRTTINLAPADVKKEGPAFDLPIALGMLASQCEIPEAALLDTAVIGELALSGEVRRVKGLLPVALCARDKGWRRILVPAENAEEAAVVEGLEVIAVSDLRSAADHLCGYNEQAPFTVAREELLSMLHAHDDDFEDVKGQESAKRAIEVAVAGGHNILMIGPPGTGKTMLAKRIPSVLPEMTLEEALDVTRIHSIAGVLGAHRALVSTRPFRSPHHTISDAGLLGGGAHPMPGEVSLSHNGVLFLDELPEFHRNVLEVMRQPLEDGQVTVSRAAASVTFPCRFMLVAAMNPCPCGYDGDTRRQCQCTSTQVQKYRARISGPLLDRIDIHIQVPSMQYQELSALAKGEPSSAIRERVMFARRRQLERLKGSRKTHCNAGMSARLVQKYCRPSPAAQSLLKQAMSEFDLSARAYERVLKVARTIADLDNSETIEPMHISEAIQYRTLDRQSWF